MKRVEAIVNAEKVSDVNEALRKIGVGGVTVLSGRGRGAGKREAVSSGRGTSYYVPEFSSKASLVTVVDDSKVDAVVNAILGAASTGAPGDGKIFVSSVDDAVDVGSKKRGGEAI
jgi:nitrogen regulatory protein P-II 1